MITPHIIGMALFAMKRGSPEQSGEWKPSKSDVMEMRKELEKYKEVIVVNGRKQYDFEQYMVAKGYCSYDKHGRLQVISPFGYYRANQIYSLHEWIQDKDQEALFQAYPEEREIAEAKRLSMIADIKNMLKNKKVDNLTARGA